MKKILSGLTALLFLAACSKKITPAAAGSQSAPSATVSVDANAKPASGQGIFESKCGRCHELPSPSAYSVKRWEPIMDHMAPKAFLTETEKNLVLDYVQANAKK